MATVLVNRPVPRGGKLPLPSGKNEAADLVQSQGSAGKAVVASADSQLQSQREEFAKLQAQVESDGLTPEQWMRDFCLTDQNGQAFGSQDLQGRPYVASFFFSTCPAICVQQNDQMRRLQQRWKDTPLRLVSITCDPDYDTPEVLKVYAERMGARPGTWYFLTGDFTYLRRVSAEIFWHGLHRRKEHIEKFLLMDANGKLVAAYDWRDPIHLQLLDRDARELLRSATPK
jgi:protein SCO1/2